MPKINEPQLNKTINHTRTGGIRPFVQYFGEPLDAAEYYGRMNISDNFGQTRPEPEIVEVPSDDVRNEFTKIAELTRSTEMGTTSFTQLADMDLSESWDELLRNDTRFVTYLLVGDDSVSPQDFTQWRSVFVLSNCKLTEITRGENSNPQTAEDNNSFVVNGTLSFWEVYTVATVKFSQVGASVITRNLLDAEIKVTDDKRTSEIFGVTANVPTTSPSAIVYGKIGGTFTQTNITSFSTDGAASSLAIVGKYLVLTQKTAAAEGHHYSTLADVRAGNNNFTKVTAGYVASSGGNKIHVVNTANIFIAADAGYVYKLKSATSPAVAVHAAALTSQNLNDISSFGKQLVAVGASSAILVSDDLGQNWSLATAPSAGLALKSVQVLGVNKWVIGTGAGAVWYTNDGGATWTQLTLNGDTATNIVEIQYNKSRDKYFGYILADTATGIELYRTFDGGNTWVADEPYTARFQSTFGAVTSGFGLSMLNQNELIVFADDILGYAIK